MGRTKEDVFMEGAKAVTLIAFWLAHATGILVGALLLYYGASFATAVFLALLAAVLAIPGAVTLRRVWIETAPGKKS